MLDVDVRGVWLGGKAVVPDIDPCISHSQAVHVIRVPSVSVLGQIVVSGQVLNDDVVIDDVLRGHDKVSPDRRASEADTLDVEVGGILSIKENRSEISVGRVLVMISYGTQ